MKVIRTEKIIRKCSDCEYCINEEEITGVSHHFTDENGICCSYYLCKLEDYKLILNDEVIPTWCKLEDYNE